jgi:hypothetical protein
VTAVSVVVALGVTAASLVGLASFRRHGTILGGGSSRGSGSSASAPSFTQPSAPLVAAFTCDGSTTSPADVSVTAGPAGVRIEVDNTSGEAMGFDEPLGGTNAPRGRHELEDPDGGTGWPLGPGDYAVKCVPNSATDPDAIAGATLHVVDPNGFWVSDRLQCTTDQEFGGVGDYPAGVDGEPLDRAVHEALDGYAVPGDVIRPVGYPEAFRRQFALVRDGRNIVLATLLHLPDDTWLPGETGGCSGEDQVKGGFRAPIRRG